MPRTSEEIRAEVERAEAHLAGLHNELSQAVAAEFAAAKADADRRGVKNACSATWFERDGVAGCHNCGSITVADLIKFLETEGTRYSGSDWKYGWPHKFYIEPPNPKADELVEIGSDHCSRYTAETPGCIPEKLSPGRFYRPIMGKRPFLHLKFYTDHLKDASAEEFPKAAELLKKFLGIEFIKEGERIRYHSPRGSFQACGYVGPNGEPKEIKF